MRIIITCGSKKCITPTIASRMYIGSHFKNCLRWARSKTDDNNILILSAKYGLLRLNQKIEYYDLKMGDRGCIGFNEVKKQALFLKILDEQILSTAGKEYRLVLDKVFKDIKYPFFNLSLGYMAQAMNRDICRN